MASEKLLTEAIESIAHQHGFRNGHYNIVLDSEHELIYIGVQKKYRIERSDGKKTMHLLVKLPSTTGFGLIPTEYSFFNNFHYFTKVQPILKQYGVVPTAPKLHASSLRRNEEYLILEDLEANGGFKRVNKSQGLTKAELALVINTLSTFHLTVRYWKTRNLSEFIHTCSQFKDFIGVHHRDRIKMYEDALKQILHATWVLSRPAYGTLLRSNIEEALMNISRKFMDSVRDVSDQPWATLVNCYTWSPNMLFRYHTVTGAPIDVAFEDWSAARIGSPILDLSFLGFASSSTSLYPELHTMLEQYFTTHLPKPELDRHYPIYGIFGVYVSLIVNVAAAFENDITVTEFKSEMLTDHNVTSDEIPDIRNRVVSIIKTAVDVGII